MTDTADERQLDPAEVTWLVYLMLECIAARCPDRRYRMTAQRDLRHPIFVEAKRLDVERVAKARRSRLELHVRPES
jgi:hypothetical protein